MKSGFEFFKKSKNLQEQGEANTTACLLSAFIWVLAPPSASRRPTRMTIYDFIWQRRDDDPHRLALSKMPEPAWSPAWVAAQVSALQRVRNKIPMWYRPGLLFPATVALEQASSERTARFKAGLFSGEKMVDLTGGLGVDTFFFAKTFRQATHVEQDEARSAAAQHNFGVLGSDNIQCIHATAEMFLQTDTGLFDLIYLDPARRDGAGGRVFLLEDCQPDILKMKDQLLDRAPLVLLKTAPMLDIRLAMEQLKQVSRVWVVAADDECREVLYLLDRRCVSSTMNVPIEAVHLLKNGQEQRFECSFGAEQAAEVSYSMPQKYLYEPNPAILKAGAFRSFAQHFSLSKLHPNTHLYTSQQGPVAELPARSFLIEAVCKYDRKSVQVSVPQGQANVAVRNFPDSAEQVRQRLGLRDGGDLYLFAVTNLDHKKVVLVCRKALE